MPFDTDTGTWWPDAKPASAGEVIAVVLIRVISIVFSAIVAGWIFIRLVTL